MELGKTQNLPRLTKREKFFYGFGDLSTALVWNVTVTWALFFFTDIFKISAMAAGTLLLVARVYDAVNDPVVGFIFDRTHSKRGKARPYLLWLAIPYGVVGSLLFFTPNLGDTGKLVYAYVFYFTLVTIYTLINIPYNSMIVLMTKDQKERTQLSRNRLLFATSGFIITSLIPMFANLLGSGETAAEIQKSGFFRSALILGAIAAAGFLLTYFNTKEHAYDPEEAAKAPKYSVADLFRALKQNRPWIVVTSMTLATSLRTSIMTAVVAYYCKYCLGRPDSFTSIVLVTTILGMACGIAIGPIIIGKIGVKKAIIAASCVNIVTGAALYPIGGNVVPMIACMLIYGIAMGIPGVSTYPMYGDAVEYGEWKTGVRVEGVIFSTYTFMQQLASGLSSFIIGVVLTFIGYNSDLAVQSQVTLNGILGLFVLPPVVLSILVIVIMRFHSFTREQYSQIISELQSRKQGG